MDTWMVFLIIGAIVVLILMFIMKTYNSLIRLRNMVKDHWLIDVLLKEGKVI